jgi:serine protease Do
MLADNSLAPVGTDVLAIGSPIGLEGTVTRGVLSGIRRTNGVVLLQFDAAINPGNSGGPLMTDSGVVLGVNTMRLVPSEFEGMGFAIAISEARRVFPGFLEGP